MAKEKKINLFLDFKKFQEKNYEKEKPTFSFWAPTFEKIRMKVAEKLDEIKATTKQKWDIQDVRSLLTNEKARLLYLIKTEKPNSLYHLAKLAGRDFKAVKQDLVLLEKFGLIKFVKEKEKNRERLKPILQADKLSISINL